MPRGDQTGPTGAGPMTGRAMGRCTGTTIPGNLPGGFGRGYGMGMGRGRGGGWGWRNGGGGFGINRGVIAFAPPTAEQELTTLKQQAAAFDSALKGIQDQIQKLESSAVPSDT